MQCEQTCSLSGFMATDVFFAFLPEKHDNFWYHCSSFVKLWSFKQKFHSHTWGLLFRFLGISVLSLSFLREIWKYGLANTSPNQTLFSAILAHFLFFLHTHHIVWFSFITSLLLLFTCRVSYFIVPQLSRVFFHLSVA